MGPFRVRDLSKPRIRPSPARSRARGHAWRPEWLGLLGLLGSLLLGQNARAYPYFVGLRHGTCSECHYSPTGGGLINDWGRASRGATFGGQDDWSAHSDAQGHDAAGQPRLQADFGGDARLLTLLPWGTNVGSRALLIPMLVEAQALAAYGDWEAYASVTSRPGTPGAPYLAFSREHWLLVRLADDLTLRFGRLVLPFGIRLPDHTQYVREDFGFDKWDQSYALEVDVSRSKSLLSAALFAGDLLWAPAQRQERGAVLRSAFTLGDDRGFAGASLLGSHSDARDRLAGSLFTGLRPFDQTYLLTELALQRFWAVSADQSLARGAAYLRLGWFPQDAVDVYAEAGYRRIVGHPELTQLRAGLGTNWQLASWLELLPAVTLEHRNGVGSELVLLGQVHLLH